MSIVVVGSSNTDLVVNVPKIPLEGETILGSKFRTHKGGKGANQAVAASRLGADTTFIACIGNDDFGNRAIKSYNEEGINTKYIQREGETSGVALITVSDQGRNTISVSPESNGLLSPKHIDQALDVIRKAKVVLTQFEIPIPTIEYLIKRCNECSAKFILNPAPALKLPEYLFKFIDIITPNETEAESLTGIKVTDEKSANLSAAKLIQKGVKEVIITLGDKGAYLHSKTQQKLIPGFKVNAIDTTAAGDTFNGALAYSITQNKPTEEAIIFANAASALAVTKNGAQSSTPKFSDVNKFLNKFI